MGCCQSTQDGIDLNERKYNQEGDGLNLNPDIGQRGSSDESESQQSSENRKSTHFPGYEQILKGRARMMSYNSNDLVSGFIDVNFINKPRTDFFNCYQIGKFLGQGGFGTVFIATHKQTKVKRAIKMVSKNRLTLQDNVVLLEEMAILKEIDHPNILKILEHYEDDQHHFFATELLSGGELLSKIEGNYGFNENKASEYMRQILSAVTYCHSRNIVHRDLKPENILFESRRDDSQIKVIDFGCSTKFDRTKKIQDIAGTVFYLAPEVIKKDLYDEKCDIWSLGVLLFIMLSGFPPFDAPTDEELFDLIQKQPLSFAGEEWNNISPEAKDLITRMLEKDPSKRLGASEAYQHSWIQQRIEKTGVQKQIMHNLALFSARNKVKTAILNLITLHILSNKDKKEIVQNFQQLDANGDGQLSKEELIQGYENVVGDRAQAEKIVAAVFQEIDYDGSGQVSFQEFLVASLNKEKMFSKENLLKAFDLIDEDQNGFITKDEIERVVGGTPLNDQVWEKMMMECDTNGDGKLDKEEFVDLLLKWLDRDLFQIDDLCSVVVDYSDVLSMRSQKQPSLQKIGKHKLKTRHSDYISSAFSGNKKGEIEQNQPINNSTSQKRHFLNKKKIPKSELSEGYLKFGSVRHHQAKSVQLSGLKKSNTEEQQQRDNHNPHNEGIQDIFLNQSTDLNAQLKISKLSFKEDQLEGDNEEEEEEEEENENDYLISNQDNEDIPLKLIPSSIPSRTHQSTNHSSFKPIINSEVHFSSNCITHIHSNQTSGSNNKNNHNINNFSSTQLQMH